MRESILLEQIVKKLEIRGIKYSRRRIKYICQKNNINLTEISPKDLQIYIFEYLSQKHKIFRSLLNEEELFDFSFMIPARVDLKSSIKVELKNSFGKLLKYSYIRKKRLHFEIFLKFRKSRFSKDFHSLPYKKALKAVEKFYKLNQIIFNELLIEKIDLTQQLAMKYNSMVSHLRQIKLPLDIVEFKPYSGFSKETMVYNEITECCLRLQSSKNWPADFKAIQIAKSAFYCLLFKKTPLRYFIDVNYFICDEKKSLFKFNILLENEYSHTRLVVDFNKMIQTKSIMFKDCIKFVKKLLGSHGFYPLIISDLYLESLFLIYISDFTTSGKMFNQFLSLDFSLERRVFNLQNLTVSENLENSDFVLMDNFSKFHIQIPKNIHLKRLQLFLSKFKQIKLKKPSELFVFNNHDIFIPCFSDFDLIFSCTKMLDFTEVKKKHQKKFILGEPLLYYDSKPLKDFENLGYFYFSPLKNILMVKIKADISLVLNLILLETNFSFYTIIQK